MKKVAVAVAQDEPVLEAIKAAKTRTMMRFNKLAISAGITDIQ